MHDDDHWMGVALEAARAAGEAGDVPIGCVIVERPAERVLAIVGNRREADRDPTAHAEIIALRAAGASLGHWRLDQCAMFVTLEPCPMCAGAAVNARLGRLVYGCDNVKAGAVRTLYRLCDDGRLNHRIDVRSAVRAEECAALLREFFEPRRR